MYCTYNVSCTGPVGVAVWCIGQLIINLQGQCPLQPAPGEYIDQYQHSPPWEYIDRLHTCLTDLHWLPIHQRILYKLSTIVYKCIHGAAPSYLTNLCVPVATNTSRRYLRSATHGNLLVPRTRMVTYGPRSFAVSGPTIWNTLPSTLRASSTTLGQFQSGLKTILFCLAYGAWLGAFVTV